MMDEQAAVASLSLHVVLHPIFKEVRLTALTFCGIKLYTLVYIHAYILNRFNNNNIICSWKQMNIV